MTDSISDMIIRVKNAGSARKESVLIPYSKLKEEICAVLEKSGFVGQVTKKNKKASKTLEVKVLYRGKEPRITDVRRISKPSRRIYKKSAEIRPVKYGYGTIILSTPKGIMTGRDAKKENVGGEALFEIW